LAFQNTVCFIIPVKLFIFFTFKLYRGMWRYTSVKDLTNLIKATFVSSGLIILAILYLHQFYGYTRSVFVIDAFLTKNPWTPTKYKDLKGLGKVDLILITHGHGDHIGDLPELAKLTGATVVGSHELVHNLVSLGFLDGAKTIFMNKGGTVAPLGPGIKVHMVAAEHSSPVDLLGVKPDTTGVRCIAGGLPGEIYAKLEMMNPMGSIKKSYKDEGKKMKLRPARAVPRVQSGRKENALRKRASNSLCVLW
jgi:hypothetical protein